MEPAMPMTNTMDALEPAATVIQETTHGSGSAMSHNHRHHHHHHRLIEKIRTMHTTAMTRHEVGRRRMTTIMTKIATNREDGVPLLVARFNFLICSMGAFNP